jgi:hypothetical protein
MEKYIRVQKCFEENKCTLLTTFEEFEEARKTVRINYFEYVRVRFIASCKHESSVVFTNFKLRKTGIRCRNCVIQKSVEKKDTNGALTEHNGIKVLEEYLSEYDVVRTKEGCKADLAIKLKSAKSDDLWIPVQVKTTNEICHGMYSFRFKKNAYKNMLIFCVCISEKKIWIMPFNELDITANINISLASKYNKYLIDNAIMKKYITGYLNQVTLLDLDTIMMPLSELQQREQEYVRKREKYVPFLEYIYPEIQGTVVDFICNGLNCQEKVVGFDKNRKRFHVDLCSNNGKENGKPQRRLYRLVENKFYWLHSSVDDLFWIIPEIILYEHGYISKENETKNRKQLLFKSEKHWIHEYEYNYNKIDTEKIMKLFTL